MSSLYEKLFIDGKEPTGRDFLEAEKDDFMRVWRMVADKKLFINCTPEEARKIKERIEKDC